MDKRAREALNASSAFSQLLFDMMMASAKRAGIPRARLNEYKRAFNEYATLEAKLIKAHGDCSIPQIRERIPNNLWLEVLRQVAKIWKEEERRGE